MKGWKTRCIAAIVVVILMSCATPVHVEKADSFNLSQFKTFQFVETRSDQNDTRNVTPFADQTIHSTVRDALTRKGLQETSNNPDLLISHDVLVEQTTQRVSNPVFTQSFTRTYFNPFLRRWGTIHYPSRFVGYEVYTVPVREGTLTITLLDAKTDKALWQAWTTEQQSSRMLTNREIERAAQRIVKKLKR